MRRSRARCSTVGAVADLAPDSARAALDEHFAALVRKDLVRPERSLIAGQDAYRFRHLLIREAAYAAMPKELRAQLHERYAEWLERTADESAFELDEIVGYHLEQALVFAPGARDARRGARALERRRGCSRRGRGRSVAPIIRPRGGLLQRAVDVRSADDRIHARGDVRARRGSSCAAASSSARDSQLLATIELARAVGDEGILARARLGYNSLRVRVDSGATVEDELAQALEIAESLEGSDELAALVDRVRGDRHVQVPARPCRRR